MPVKTPADGSVPTSHLERDGFRAAMRELAGGVRAISCRHSGQLAGFTATSVSSLSVDPPSLVVCVNRSASLYAQIARGDAFGVSVLGAQHAEFANRFASR